MMKYVILSECIDNFFAVHNVSFSVSLSDIRMRGNELHVFRTNNEKSSRRHGQFDNKLSLVGLGYRGLGQHSQIRKL